MAGADLLKHQTRKETPRMDELGAIHVGRLARLRRCWFVTALASPVSQRLLDHAVDWRAKTARCDKQIGIEDDTLLTSVRMPVASQRRHRHLPLFGCRPARHRTCKLRYLRAYSKTFNHWNVFDYW